MKKMSLCLILACLCIFMTASFSHAWDSTVNGQLVGVGTNPWDNRVKIIANVGGVVTHFKLAADNPDINKFLAMAMTGMSVSHTATIYYTAATKNIDDIQMIKQ